MFLSLDHLEHRGIHIYLYFCIKQVIILDSRKFVYKSHICLLKHCENSWLWYTMYIVTGCKQLYRIFVETSVYWVETHTICSSVYVVTSPSTNVIDPRTEGSVSVTQYWLRLFSDQQSKWLSAAIGTNNRYKSLWWGNGNPLTNHEISFPCPAWPVKWLATWFVLSDSLFVHLSANFNHASNFWSVKITEFKILACQFLGSGSFR